MANTLSTHTLRQTYFKSNLSLALRKALVAEAICTVDRTEQKTVENPYVTEVTAAIQAVAGTYTVAARTTNDDTLTVADEVIVGTHVFDFEKLTSNFNLTADFLDDLMYQVAFKTDQFVLNKILDIATGTYTTPAGGFTTAANIPVICSNLLSKVAGFQSGIATNPFLVIESTDIVGFAQAQVASGFSYADSALNNGFMTNYMGIKIYVVRTGTFVTATLGTLTAANSGHRLFGISKLAMFASPRGVSYDEKGVTEKTGREIEAHALVGATIWTPQRGLFVDITLA
jgi:hypothetical protein